MANDVLRRSIKRNSLPPPHALSPPHTPDRQSNPSYESFSDLTPTPRTSTPPRNAQIFSTPQSSFAPPSPTPPTQRTQPTQRTHSHNPDPTNSTGRGEDVPTKFNWRRYGSMGGLAGQNDDEDDDDDYPTEEEQGDRKDWLSTWQLIGLTIGLAGAQLTWTVEMAFGTPYLLSLGLTKESTSLVWLAGPLSGLLVQPIIGALSDSSTSKYRRRSFIVGSTFFVILSTLVVAYARAIASLANSLGGLGDWDPEQEERIKGLAIAIAVVAFYILDFSLNGLQASLRALILDRSPSSQQNIANAWHGRMTHIANIFGYLAGWINLGQWSAIDWIGGGQFRRLAVLSCAVMIVCVSITCYTQEETPKRVEGGSGGKGIGLGAALRNVRVAIRVLPVAVQRVCAVQFFAWSAWFPFLFYTTTWIAEIFYANIPPHTPKPSPDTATRAGSLALLNFALVALLAGSLLPFLSTLGRRPFIFPLSQADSTAGRITRRVLCFMTPRNFWGVGLAVYAGLMGATFWVNTVGAAMIIVALLGIPWAVNCWVPFALVMEAIRDLDTPSSSPAQSSTTNQPTKPSSSTTTPTSQPFRAQLPSSTLNRDRADSSIHATESTALLSSAPTNDRTNESDSPYDSERAISAGGEEEGTHPTGGTILGIHNLSIVTPQFFIALIAALIFKLLGAEDPSDPSSFDPSSPSPSPSPGDSPGGNGGSGGGNGGGLKNGNNDVIWVLRFGGLMAAIGVLISRRLLKTKSEIAYRKFLEGGVRMREGMQEHREEDE